MLELENIHKTYEGQPLLQGISFTVAQGETVCQGKPFQGLAVTADGSLAAAGDAEGTIHLIELSTARELRAWKGHSLIVGNLVFHGGGREVLSVADDGYLRRWSVGTGDHIAECIVPFGGLFGVAAATDGSRIVGAKWKKGLALWSGSAGDEPMIFQENVASQSPVSLPADGSFAERVVELYLPGPLNVVSLRGGLPQDQLKCDCCNASTHRPISGCGRMPSASNASPLTERIARASPRASIGARSTGSSSSPWKPDSLTIT